MKWWDLARERSAGQAVVFYLIYVAAGIMAAVGTAILMDAASFCPEIVGGMMASIAYFTLGYGGICIRKKLKAAGYLLLGAVGVALTYTVSILVSGVIVAWLTTRRNGQEEDESAAGQRYG